MAEAMNLVFRGSAAIDVDAAARSHNALRNVNLALDYRC